MDSPGKKFCPFCGKELKATVSHCNSCGSMLGGVRPSDVKKKTADDAAKPPLLSTEGGTLARGDSVGNYMVLRFLRRDAAGERFLAMDKRSKKPVCLHLLDPVKTRDADAVPRFREESQRLMGLAHSNLAVPLDAWVEGGRCYLANPWVEGQTLAQLLVEIGKSPDPVPLKTVLLVLGDLLSALAAGHQSADRVCHGDLRPENVLFSKQGRTVLLDYGVHLLFRPGALGFGNLKDPGLEFRSPEILKGEPLGPASDLYGVGVILYRMLAGRVPFPRTTLDAAECIHGHLGATPLPLSALRPDVPEWLVHRIHRALQKNPSHRYRDAAAMMTASSEAAESSSAIPSGSAGAVAVPAGALELLHGRVSDRAEPIFPELVSQTNEWEVEVSWGESRMKKKLYLVGGITGIAVAALMAWGIASLWFHVGFEDDDDEGIIAGALLEGKGRRPELAEDPAIPPGAQEGPQKMLASPADEILNRDAPVLGRDPMPGGEDLAQNMAEQAARRMAANLEEAKSPRKTGGGFSLRSLGGGRGTGDGTEPGAGGAGLPTADTGGGAATSAGMQPDMAADEKTSSGQATSSAAGTDGTADSHTGQAKVPPMQQAQHELASARRSADAASKALEETALWLEVVRGKREMSGVSLPEAARRCRAAANQTRSAVGRTQSDSKKARAAALKARDAGESADQVQRILDELDSLYSTTETLPKVAEDWALRAERRAKEWEKLE